MLVKPTYKESWEIPGGVVEEDESPWQCCRREINEELSLELEPTRLLLVDYNSANQTKTESLMFVFCVPPLSESCVCSISLPKDELIEFAFFDVSKLPDEMTHSLRCRVQRAYELFQSGETAYFDNLDTACEVESRDVSSSAL